MSFDIFIKEYKKMTEQTIDLIIKILGWIIPEVVAFIMGRLTKKVEKHDKATEEEEEKKKKEEEIRKQEAYSVKETCKYILKKSLKDDYEFYDKQGWCSVTDKAEMEKAYKIYSGPILKGNSQGTMYYKATMALPEHPIEHNGEGK